MAADMAQPLSASTLQRAAAPVRRSILACGALLLCFASLASAQKTAGSALTSLLGQTQQKPATSTPEPAPAAPQPAHASAAIPLPDVAARSEDVKRMLRSLSNQLPTSDQLEAAQQTLDERDAELNAREKEVDALVAGTPTSLELREQANYWRIEQGETASLRRQLLEWANAAQSAIKEVQAQQPVWQATLDENENTPGLGPTLELIRQSLNQLKQLTEQAQNQLKTIVNLQVRAATQDQIALESLDRLSKAHDSLDRRLFERDSLPLWQMTERRQLGESSELFVPASQRLAGIRSFAAQAKGALIFLFLLTLLSLFGAYRLYLATRQPQPATERQQQVMAITKRWFALGLLPPLLCAYVLAPLAPLPLIGVVILLSFIPILSLLPPLVPAWLRTLLYCLAAVYAFSAFIAWAGFSAFHKRQVQFLIDLGVFLVFVYLTRPSRLRHLYESRSETCRILLMRLAVAVLGASVLANLFGYLKLAQFLAILCLYSAFVAISMMTGVLVFTPLLLEGLETQAAQQLAAVRTHGDAIARWVPRLLRWTGFVVWLIVTANLMGISSWFGRIFANIFDFRIAGGNANVTLGGVLGFFLILLFGYAISSTIRFLLREELLGRFHLARGVPELIASTFHYLLLVLVFFFAVNAGGVELNKFTVLTGALGVGVGFGLQNIVNNFISGLILQFERPIHIGDVLDVDGTTGKVTRIGIRSSTVKTFQGAELIVPNGNFISGKVINWTLTESQRRMDLPIGVAYGSDPELVITLLVQAATQHESVLTTPAPAAYFKEFADSSLNFELQFWVMQESNTVKVKSEVALSVMQLLDDAGIEIPFPQRDLRLRSVNPDAAAMLLPMKDATADLAHPAEPKLVVDRSQRQRAGE